MTSDSLTEKQRALEKAGYDIEELKGRKGAARRDLFKDKKGNVYVKPKDGGGPGEPVGINIKDFRKN